MSLYAFKSSIKEMKYCAVPKKKKVWKTMNPNTQALVLTMNQDEAGKVHIER